MEASSRQMENLRMVFDWQVLIRHREFKVISIYGHILEAVEIAEFIKGKGEESVANNVRTIPDLRVRRRKRLEEEYL